jgi:hypothetical protein
MYRELLLGCALSLGIVLLAPLNLWHGLGDTGSVLAILVSAAAITGAVVWRNRDSDSMVEVSS